MILLFKTIKTFALVNGIHDLKFKYKNTIFNFAPASLINTVFIDSYDHL